MNKKFVKVLGSILLVFAATLLVLTLSDKKWTIRLPGNDYDVLKMKTDQQNLYLAIGNTQVYAISYSTGEIAWRFSAAQKTIGLAPGSLMDDKVSMALGQNVLYVETANSVFALHTENGEVIWVRDFEIPLNVDAGILLTDEKLLTVVSESGLFQAMKPTNGEDLWSAEMTIITPAQTLKFRSISENYIILVTGEISYYSGAYDLSAGELKVLAAESGKELWSLDQSYWTSTSLTSLPVVLDLGNRVYMASYNLITSFASDTGETLWQTSVLGAFRHLVVLEKNLVAIGYGGMAIVDLDSGKVLCEQTVSEVQGRGEIIAQDGELFYVQPRKVIPTFLWWESKTWKYKTDFYVIDTNSCELQLRDTVNGHLIAYDPSTKKGVISEQSNEEIMLKQVHISLE